MTNLPGSKSRYAYTSALQLSEIPVLAKVTYINLKHIIDVVPGLCFI